MPPVFVVRHHAASQYRNCPAWYWKRRNEIIDMQCDNDKGATHARPITIHFRHGAGGEWRGIRAWWHPRGTGQYRQAAHRTRPNAQGLVTREEFDALRTRHDAMAARVAELENRLARPARPQRQRKAREKGSLDAPQGIAVIRLTRFFRLGFLLQINCVFLLRQTLSGKPLFMRHFTKLSTT